jgi:hypothetical protein
MSNIVPANSDANGQETFNFNGIEVRVHVDIHGRPWFCVADIAKALDHSDPSKLAAVVKPDQKGKYPIRTRSETGVEQARGLLCVNEAGLKAILVGSSKPKARQLLALMTGEPIVERNREARCVKARAKKTHDLYRAFNAEGTLLYVGISFSAIARLMQHKQTSAWWDDAVEIRIEKFATDKDARRAEAEAICNEKPLHNVAGAVQ